MEVVAYVEGKRYPWGESNPCVSCYREMYRPGHKIEGKVRYHAKGRCATCYHNKGAIASFRSFSVFDDNGKICARCKTHLAYDKFAINSTMKSGYNSWCKRCGVLKGYNLTRFEYDSLLEAQGGTCAICPNTGDVGKVLAVDHDHSCCPGIGSCGKCVRGLLCSDCNRAIGLLKDSPELVLNSYTYLMKERYGKSN